MTDELKIALTVSVIGGVLLIAALIKLVGGNRHRFRALLCVTMVLTFVVVVVGAYVRLSDAGLGCPDWPGCYGHLDVPRTAAERAAADAKYPSMPVDIAKGWKEMGHRYIAGLLGLLIVAVAGASMRHGKALGQSVWLPLALVAVVIFQAALGRWTVTMLLKPVIVTLHLIGGMTILALITLLASRYVPWGPDRGARGVLRPAALIGLLLVAAQIILGGWVSTNYAALACPDLPLCRGALMPPMDFTHAFHLLRELGQTAQGELLPNEALIAIHWLHRVGAIIVSAYLVWLSIHLVRQGYTNVAVLTLVVLCAQVTLGVTTVAFSLPLPLAAAHNAGAATLLMSLVVVNFRVFSGTSVMPSESAIVAARTGQFRVVR
jgi:heme a synthase